MPEDNQKQVDEISQKIFEKIAKNDTDGFKQLLPQLKSANGVNFVDSNGMTPLQHACCKGNKDIVSTLLDMGADINFNQHGANYTPLHFAALSGNIKVCRMLLDAGINPSIQNSVSRTAQQMAAFVGNHACVETINNYVPRKQLEPYTRVQGQQKEPLIPSEKLDALHNFVSDANLHPVRIVLNLQAFGLLKYLPGLRNVLQTMCANEMCKSNDVNELMAFKFHYLGWIIFQLTRCEEQCKAQRKEKGTDADADDADASKNDYVELFIKRVLKENKLGQLDFIEFTIRECVREFPYRECTIFRQVVTQLASKDAHPALFVLRHAINGQRGFIDEMSYCSSCGNEQPDKKCSKCKAVQYCDRECQRLHWFMHKKTCARPNSTGAGPSTAAPELAKPPIDTEELREELAKMTAN